MRFFVILDDVGAIQQQLAIEHHPLDPPMEGANPLFDVPAQQVVEVDRLGVLEFERLVDGEWSLDLAAKKSQGLRQIDGMRPTSDVFYPHERKRLELAKYDAAGGDLTGLSLPWMEAEAAALATDVPTVAETVRDKVEEEDQAVASREAALIAAKQSIREATTAEEIDAIVESVR